jgi:hypothetical protein
MRAFFWPRRWLLAGLVLTSIAAAAMAGTWQRGAAGARPVGAQAAVAVTPPGAGPLSLAASRRSLAAAVTAYVQSALAPRALALESGVALANRHIGAHLSGREDDGTLAAVFTREAGELVGASNQLAELPPARDTLVALQLKGAAEDLAVAGTQLSDLLLETAATLRAVPAAEANGAMIVTGGTELVGYEPRARSAVALLKRAEQWLETIDHETGAQAVLPGFEGGRTLEQLLNVLW